MADTFAIRGVAVPLSGANYFADPLSAQNGITPSQLLDRIVSLGANDVRLVGSYGLLAKTTAVTYAPFTVQSVESLKIFTDEAHARGLSITWNPISHFDGVIAGDNTQDSHINPTDPAQWFASYRDVVLEQARIAEAIGAERYTVLSDIEQFAFLRNPGLADDMVALIGEVRQVYHGQITSVLWSPDGKLTGFPTEILQALDLVGLGLFPHLTGKTDPTLGELQAAFHADVDGNDIVANLARLHADLAKPIWFSDLAQSSYDGWLRDNPQKFDPTANYTADTSEQVLGYQAFFNTMLAYGSPWFQGLSIQNIQRVDDFHGQVAAYYSGPFGEDFWGKPGEQIIRDYFTGAVAVPVVELRGTNYGESVIGGSFGPMILHAGQADQTLSGGSKDDIFHAATVAHGVPVHQLTLTLVGASVNGILPTFMVRINGEMIPLEYQVSAANGTAPATLTIPVFETGRIDAIQVITTNWIAGDDYNRYMRVAGIGLDGVDLAGLHPVYHPNIQPEEPFTGDTNRGGYVVYDTSSINPAASATMNLSANTRIDGRGGLDTVVYDGTAAQFAVARSGGDWIVHKPGAGAGEGVDTLTDIEMLQFSDRTVWIGASLDASAATGSQAINLAAGQTSNVTLGGVLTSLVSSTDGGEAHGGGAGDTLRGGGQASRLFGGGGDDTITGGDAANYLRGEDGRDSLVGGAGFDDMNGNMGADTASGGAGDDWVVGGKDADLLSGDAGDDIVYGNLGDDWCDGGAGADLIRGGQNNDVLLGQGGADWLSGDKGDDTVTGGAGADIFHTFGEADLDWVTDFSVAEGDRVQLDPGTTYAVAQVGADTVINMTGGGRMVLVGVQLAALPEGWIFGA